MRSNSDASKSYSVNDTDWIVIGPNLEAVYTNAYFTSLFSSAGGNTMSFTVGPDSADPMSANLIAFVGGAAGTLSIDWGDGSAHSTPSVAVGISAPIAHAYTMPGRYSILVKYLVGAVQTATAGQAGGFQAVVPPPPGTGTAPPSYIPQAAATGAAPGTMGGSTGMLMASPAAMSYSPSSAEYMMRSPGVPRDREHASPPAERLPLQDDMGIGGFMPIVPIRGDGRVPSLDEPRSTGCRAFPARPTAAAAPIRPAADAARVPMRRRTCQPE